MHSWLSPFLFNSRRTPSFFAFSSFPSFFLLQEISNLCKRQTWANIDVRMHLSFFSVVGFFWTAWSFTVTAATNDGTCYDVDGGSTSSSFNTPCDLDAESSLCCSFGNACLSNGLCGVNQTQHPGDLTPFYTGRCTERLWNSSVCPRICNNDRTG